MFSNLLNLHVNKNPLFWWITLNKLLSVTLTKKVIFLLLLISGTLELNPGPMNSIKLKNLSACHINIRSLSASKVGAIKTDLSDNFDIISISETFLNENSSVNLKIEGFHEIIRRDRPTFGGGIAIYIRENIVFKRKIQYDDRHLEILWLELNTIEGKMLICTAYRPPNYVEFWEHLERNIETVKANENTKYILIMGDLNADFSDVNGDHLLNLCAVQNLTCHISEPTRITPTSQTCLDQIISNMPNFVTSTSITPPLSTNDHCTVSINLDFKIVKDEPYTRLLWNYKEGDYIGFKNALSEVNWDECFESSCVNKACSMWCESFLNVARMYIPNKMVLIRPKDSPWYTNELRKFKRKVNRLFKKAKRTLNPNHWNDYKQASREYKSKLDIAEENYNKSLYGSLVTSRNNKMWWKTVNNILGRGGDDSYPPITDPTSNTSATHNSDKVELFKNYFLSHSNIDTSNARLPNEINQMPELNLDNISATEDEVLDLLKCIDPAKATGHDGISPKLIKEAGISIVPSLTRLINLSFEKSIVPDNWKMANVIPIHKKDDKDVVSNYRPISLLPAISKIMERIVFKKVYNFFHTNGLLTKHQSGFRPGDSTINQLAYLYHTFCDALDKKKDVRIVFCDVSKAFDKVWHRGLIYKLRKIGITGNLLKWFEDYLNNRKQRVIIKGQCSEWGFIKAGVPQGSVLGPLLFLVYINDLAEQVQCEIKLFADDTSLFIALDDPQAAADALNNDMEQISIYANMWLVNFNATKTKCMTITRRNINHPPITFQGKQLQDVDYHKHLGVTFSKNLNWSEHIKNILDSSSKMLDILRRLKHDIDRKTLETIYFTFIRPKLEYASPVWDDCCDKEKVLLENFQLSAARIVSGAKKGTSHQLIYDEVAWPKLSDRRKDCKLKFIHKIVHGTSPDYLVELLPGNVGEGMSYNLRQKNNIKLFKARTEKFKNSLIPDCIRLWNNLDDEWKNIEDNDKFNSKITSTNSCAANPLFYLGERTVNIILSQMRMNCSNLKGHLALLHVEDDPMCYCSYDIENTEHYFLHCPLYHIERMELSNIVNQISDFNVQTLLHGDKNVDYDANLTILNAVHKFIVNSGRFR